MAQCQATTVLNCCSGDEVQCELEQHGPEVDHQVTVMWTDPAPLTPEEVAEYTPKPGDPF